MSIKPSRIASGQSSRADGRPCGLPLLASSESFELVEVRTNRLDGGHGVNARGGLASPLDLSRDHLTEPDARGRRPAQLPEGFPGRVVYRNARYACADWTLPRRTSRATLDGWLRRRRHLDRGRHMGQRFGRRGQLRGRFAGGSFALQSALAIHARAVAPLYTALQCNCVPGSRRRSLPRTLSVLDQVAACPTSPELPSARLRSGCSASIEMGSSAFRCPVEVFASVFSERCLERRPAHAPRTDPVFEPTKLRH